MEHSIVISWYQKWPYCTNQLTIPEITVTYSHPNKSKIKVTSSSQAYEVFKTFFPVDSIELQERMVVMYLNKSNQVLGIWVHSIGGQVGTIVDIRLILAVALKTASVNFMVAHNHPSSNLQPSEQDKVITERLKDAGKLLDLQLTDHLIISSIDGCFYSFNDEGML